MDAGIILSAKQCIEFGLQSLATGFYYQAIDWMQTAVKKVTSQADVTADLEESRIQLETTKKLVGSYAFLPCLFKSSNPYQLCIMGSTISFSAVRTELSLHSTLSQSQELTTSLISRPGNKLCTRKTNSGGAENMLILISGQFVK